MSATIEEEINPQQVEEIAHAIAGAGGGALSMALTYPLVTISTKLQAEDKSNGKDKEKPKKTARETIKEIYQKDGITGFYAGLESAVYGMAVTNFVYYYFYESTGRAIQRYSQHKRLNALESIITGAIAGSATAVASNPIWVANTRMTITKSEESTLSMILRIIRDDGVLTLFNGLKPALILVLNPIIQYTVFEQLKNLILGLQENRSPVLSPSWAFLLGAIGKLIATGTTYPYITLKTRMHMAGDKNAEKATKQAETAKVTAFEIVKREGVSGLYRGIGYKLVQSILTAAFLFYFKEGFVLLSIKFLRVLRQLNSKTSLRERNITISRDR